MGMTNLDSQPIATRSGPQPEENRKSKRVAIVARVGRQLARTELDDADRNCEASLGHVAATLVAASDVYAVRHDLIELCAQVLLRHPKLASYVRRDLEAAAALPAGPGQECCPYHLDGGQFKRCSAENGDRL